MRAAHAPSGGRHYFAIGHHFAALTACFRYDSAPCAPRGLPIFRASHYFSCESNGQALIYFSRYRRLGRYRTLSFSLTLIGALGGIARHYARQHSRAYRASIARPFLKRRRCRRRHISPAFHMFYSFILALATMPRSPRDDEER